MKLWYAIITLALATFATPVHNAEFKLKLPLGLQESAAYIPDDNPLTPEKIALGKQFFWDKRWSRNGTVACVTCHEPDHGWGDARQFSARFDGKPTPRHSPTLVNRLFSDAQQWTIMPLDGSELAEQVLSPVAELAKQLKLEVVLFRAYTIPLSAMAVDPEGLYVVVSDEELIAALKMKCDPCRVIGKRPPYNPRSCM